MKKIAIIESETLSNVEAITKYFSKKDVEVLRLDINKHLTVDYFTENKFDLVILTDFAGGLPIGIMAEMGQVINLHPSILPAFKGEESIKQAFLAGVKVSGITIHWVQEADGSGKIIAQYPVFICNSTSFTEFEEEIHKVADELYPIVIEKILEDKVFDFQDLIKNSSDCGCGGGSCGGGCGGH